MFKSIAQYYSWKLFIVGYLLIGCNPTPTSLEGLWVETSGDDVLCFQNDTFYNSYNSPSPYHLEGHTIVTQDSLYTLGSNRIPFQQKGDLLEVQLKPDQVQRFKKSKFDRLFDHNLDTLDLHIELPNGQSCSSLPGKTPIEFLFLSLTKDASCLVTSSIHGRITQSPIDQYEPEVSQEVEFKYIALAVDSNLSFWHYAKVFTLLLADQPVHHYYTYYCPPSQKGWFPWATVGYEKMGRLNLVSALREKLPATFILVNLSLDSKGNVLVNDSIIGKEFLYKHLSDMYAKDAANLCFQISPTPQFTFGEYIQIHSMLRQLVLEHRIAFSKTNFNKDFEQLKKNSISFEGRKSESDSLYRHVRSVFPIRLIINDLNPH